jgi:hypothetical protein
LKNWDKNRKGQYEKRAIPIFYKTTKETKESNIRQLLEKLTRFYCDRCGGNTTSDSYVRRLLGCIMALRNSTEITFSM